MEIASSSSKPIKHDNPEVLKFIKESSIEQGETKVPAYFIWYEYYKWSRNKKRLSKTKFFIEFSKHFEKKRQHDTNAYLLNNEPFDLSTDGYFAARALVRRERDVREKRKEKNKKK